jgi:hypothetical protein
MDDSAQYNGRPVAAPATGQLRFFQISTLILAVLLFAGVGYYEYRQHAAAPVAILVNGSAAATVESITVASSIIHAVHERQVGDGFMTAGDPHFSENVTFQRTASSAQLDSDDAATTKLAAVVHTIVQGDVIIVNKKWIVALPDAATAQMAVDELRDHYAALAPVAPLAEKPSFVQDVTIERHTVPATQTCGTSDEAAALLWTPPAPKIYTVLPHQTGWLIAKKFKLSFADFLRANSNIDVNRIAPGDTVIVSKTFPPIDVIVKKLVQHKETFGGTGVRQLTVEATYIDGQLSGTPIATSMITLQRATPARTLD